MSYRRGRNIFVLFLLFILTMNACSSFAPEFTCVQSPHELIPTSKAKILWSKSGSMTGISSQPMVLSTPGQVLAAVDTYYPYTTTLYSYVTLTGELLWSRHVGSPPIVLSSKDSTLYLAQYSKVYLYDSANGEILKELTLSDAGNFDSLYIDDDTIFTHAHGRSGIFFVYNLSNDTYTERDLSTLALRVDQNILYIIDQEGLKAIDQKTKSTIWKIALQESPVENVAQFPVFSGNMIIASTQGDPDPGSVFPGHIYAVDKTTGHLLWKKTLGIVSNIEAKNNKLYFLTVEGDLVILDQLTGQEISRLGFWPRPFVLPKLDWIVGGYDVAVDPISGTIVIALGDSCELLALALQ